MRTLGHTLACLTMETVALLCCPDLPPPVTTIFGPKTCRMDRNSHLISRLVSGLDNSHFITITVSRCNACLPTGICPLQAGLLQFSSDWCSRRSRLQSVQNAAARLVSGARRHDHITPVLTKLHWLPVRKRVMFKTVVLVWKCLNGIALGYLSELCVPVASASGCQHLRSASTGLLQVPRARTTIGRRSFAVAGPSL